MTSTRLPARVEVAVIGAGQAGLTMSWHLQQAGREHVLAGHEQRRLAEVVHAEREVATQRMWRPAPSTSRNLPW